jgi:hypothetical protein
MRSVEAVHVSRTLPYISEVRNYLIFSLEGFILLNIKSLRF